MQNIDNAISGEYVPTDTNSPAFGATHFGRDTERGITDGMSPGLGALTKFGLGVGRAVTTLPLGPTVGPMIIAGGAAGDSTHNTLDSGAGNEAALLDGMLDGARVYPYARNVQRLMNGVRGQVSGQAAPQAGGQLTAESGINKYNNTNNGNNMRVPERLNQR